MFTKSAEFTMVQDGTEGDFGWMIENVDLNDINDIGKFVRDSAKMYINATNNSSAKDNTVYKVWRSGNEFDRAITYIRNAKNN